MIIPVVNMRMDARGNFQRMNRMLQPVLAKEWDFLQMRPFQSPWAHLAEMLRFVRRINGFVPSPSPLPPQAPASSQEQEPASSK